MRKGLVAVLTGLLAAVAVAADTAAPIPKEGTLSGTNYFSSSVKVLPLGKDSVQVIYEGTGVRVSDTGDILHNASLRCLGGLHAVNGSFEDESGSCVFTRPDGDQAFMRIRVAGKMGIEAKGTGTFVGGTGKLTGLQGSVEFSRTYVRPAAEGTSQSINRMTKGTYKLP